MTVKIKQQRKYEKYPTSNNHLY